MASSASGYAALASCLRSALNLDCRKSYEIARLGSGSACRSMIGGFVRWEKGTCSDGSDSLPVQLFHENHWPELRIVLLVTETKQKGNPSTSAMHRSALSSEYLKFRVKYQVEKRLNRVYEAIKTKDFAKFGKLVMQESNALHSICMDTYPPIEPPYLNSCSHAIIRLITAWNDECGHIKAAYTFDAGPNPFIFILEEDLRYLFSLLVFYGAKLCSDMRFCNLNCDMKLPVEDISDEVAQICDFCIFKVGGAPDVNIEN